MGENHRTSIGRQWRNHQVLHHLPSARNSWLGSKGALTAAGGHASAEDVGEWGLDVRQRYDDSSHQTSRDCLE